MSNSPFRRLWNDPVGRARLEEAQARGVKSAAEWRRARFPMPDTPEGKRLYSKLCRHLGAIAARKAMNLHPAPLGFSGTATSKGTEREGDRRPERLPVNSA